MSPSEELRNKLDNELKVWDELVQEFRKWERSWRMYDAHPTCESIPCDSVEFMEKLNKKYNLSKK